MSETEVDTWWEHPEEYMCTSCGGSATGRSCVVREVRGSPQVIRQSIKNDPYQSEISDWADGNGCNVLSTQLNMPNHDRLCESRRHGPMMLICDHCHNGPQLPNEEDSASLYWRISTRHGEIWAYNRQHLVAVRDHIKLERRPQGFIKLPGWMLASKNRNELVKLIDRALQNGPQR